MELTLKVTRTVSGYIISGCCGDTEIDPDVAKTARQAALRVRELVEIALNELEATL